MKAVIEFGNRGGFHVDNLVFPSVKLAIKTAASIVMVLANDANAPGARETNWFINKYNPRDSFSSEFFYVSVSILDGVPRGCASADLWRKPSASGGANG